MEFYDVTCPHCWQVFAVPLDCSVPGQCFIYDCEGCCNPLEVEYEIEDGRVTYCEARSIEQ